MDAGFIPRLLSVINSIDLWVFIAFAFAAYAALFVPSFGGIELVEFKKDIGPWCWLVAVVFSIFSIVRATDLISKTAHARSDRRRRRARNIYINLYAPLYAELMNIHVVTATSVLAPKFRDRWENAVDKLRTIKSRSLSIRRRRAVLKAAWTALFDRQETEERGEVEYGGAFPIDEIDRLVRDNPLNCDDTLLTLVRRAISTRIENGVSPHDVTPDDVRLYRHIFQQRDRLKRVYDR
jgi:hypothetical protein